MLEELLSACDISLTCETVKFGLDIVRRIRSTALGWGRQVARRLKRSSRSMAGNTGFGARRASMERRARR
jgi:hypothetical protein